jgi:hypothetical protein
MPEPGVDGGGGGAGNGERPMAKASLALVDIDPGYGTALRTRGKAAPPSRRRSNGDSDDAVPSPAWLSPPGKGAGKGAGGMPGMSSGLRRLNTRNPFQLDAPPRPQSAVGRGALVGDA